MEKVIHWNNMELFVSDFKHSHANGGRLGKFWVTDLKSGRIFMIKGSSPNSYEPFSEKMAYIIGKNLGIDVLEYDIIPAELFKGIIPINRKCKYLSICEKIDRKNYSISSIAEIKRARNAILEDFQEPVKNKEVMYDILTKEYIDTMLLFDAIIGNEDRHYGNVHVLRSINGNIKGAPILDNGASLLAMRKIMILPYLLSTKVGDFFNKSFTTQPTHDKQLEDVESIHNIGFNITTKTINILKEIQPTLDLMPKLRAKVVKKFIVYRLHKYLGMMKYEDTAEYFKNRRSIKRNFKEKEKTGFKSIWT